MWVDVQTRSSREPVFVGGPAMSRIGNLNPVRIQLGIVCGLLTHHSLETNFHHCSRSLPFRDALDSVSSGMRIVVEVIRLGDILSWVRSRPADVFRRR